MPKIRKQRESQRHRICFKTSLLPPYLKRAKKHRSVASMVCTYEVSPPDIFTKFFGYFFSVKKHIVSM
ncbi:MAG: hypothetical protein ACTS73_08300 [Arsenophonus sp. NEOnobi-MAG3]